MTLSEALNQLHRDGKSLKRAGVTYRPLRYLAWIEEVSSMVDGLYQGEQVPWLHPDSPVVLNDKTLTLYDPDGMPTATVWHLV